MVGAVYDRALDLTPAGSAGLTGGTITNLVAIDAHKVFELAQEGHQIWSCPLAMVIVTVLLLLELGPSTLVGMVTMFLLVPVVRMVVAIMMRVRRDRVSITDKRVEATMAMLRGIRFAKLNHYEERFLSRVTRLRAEESRLLRKELAVLAFTFFLTVVSPAFATAVTFATYVLMGDGNVLTTSTTFTTLFLFAALRFPINYAVSDPPSFLPPCACCVHVLRTQSFCPAAAVAFRALSLGNRLRVPSYYNSLSLSLSLCVCRTASLFALRSGEADGEGRAGTAGEQEASRLLL